MTKHINKKGRGPKPAGQDNPYLEEGMEKGQSKKDLEGGTIDGRDSGGTPSDGYDDRWNLTDDSDVGDNTYEDSDDGGSSSGVETQVNKPDNEDTTTDDSQPIEIEYFADRSYFFIFGLPSAGKTVLISSIYDYLKTQRSSLYSDRLENLNRKGIVYEEEGNRLLNELISTKLNRVFPRGTRPADQKPSRVPSHLNFNFIPSDKDYDEFPFCFMDMAGEDLAKLDYESDRTLPKSIKAYIEKLPRKNLRFIFIFDPTRSTDGMIKQVQLFHAFIDLIEENGHRETPILFLVTKWDVMKEKFNSVKEYLNQEELETIYGTLNEAGRNFRFGRFSIGEVNQDNKISKYDRSYAERVFNWMYESQIGVDLPKVQSSTKVDPPIVDPPKGRSFLDKLREIKEMIFN